VGIGGFGSANVPYNVALFPTLIPLGEGEDVGHIFNSVGVQIDFELVHTFWVVTGRWDGPENGMANINDKRGARFAAKDIQIRNVEANVLPRDR
jgi:hypothetical protein